MSIETLEKLERKATLSIKKSDIDASVKKEVEEKAKTAKIQGFRPGKAPLKIVEQMYGGQAFEEALNRQLNQAFLNLVEEHNIELAGYPKFDLTNSEGEEFVFSAIFEVMPELKISNLSTQEIICYQSQITDEDVDTAIDTLRKQRATYSDAASDAVANNSDKVTIDFVGTVDNVEFEHGSAKDYNFILGQGHMPADFENGIINMKSGESKDVKVNFPESYQASNLRGKTANFKITVTKIENPATPELNSEFIQALGVSDGSVETLKKEIKESLEYEMATKIFALKRESALKALENSCTIDAAPNSIVNEEIQRMMENAEKHLLKQGHPKDKIKLNHDMFKTSATHTIKSFLIIQAFIKNSKIEVSDDELRQIIRYTGSFYKQDPENYLKEYLQDEKRMQNARAIILENRVISLITSQAKPIDKTISYSELIKLTQNLQQH